MRTTILSMFINGDTPPDLGFTIVWYDNITDVLTATDEVSGYFKPNSSGGKSNIMVFADSTYVPPVSEINLSSTDSFSVVVMDKKISNKPGIFLKFDDCPNLDIDSIVDLILDMDDGESDREIWTKGSTEKIKEDKKVKLKDKKWKIKE